MKNLVVVGERLSQLEVEQLLHTHAHTLAQEAATAATSSAPAASSSPATSAPSISALALDAPSATLYLVTHRSLFLSYSLSRHQCTMCVSLRGQEEAGSASSRWMSASDEVVALKYVSELEQVVLATREGKLFSISTDMPPGCAPSISLVDEVPAGLGAMSWSPDEELCVLLTAEGAVQLRTKEMDLMYDLEIFANPQDAGSFGNQASNPPLPRDQLHSIHTTYGVGCVSWRGDGQFFVVNALEPHSLRRFNIVFDRQLVRQSVSEGTKAQPLDGSADGAGGLVEWRPSGNLYFTPAHRRISPQLTKHELWAYEKNGLRHGEIAVANVVTAAPASSSTTAAAAAKPKPKPKPRRKAGDDDDDEDDDYSSEEEADESASVDPSTSSHQDHLVLDLAWNADSDIFAVRMVNRRTKAQCVRLYTTMNYHWYLKQELVPSVETTQDGVATSLHFMWHSEDARRMVLLESTGLVRTVDLVWDGCVSAHAQSRTAAVIDGPSVLLTPLGKMMMPPPMSTWKIHLPTSMGHINQVAFRPSPLGALYAARGEAKFSMPNQQTEKAAFIIDHPTNTDEDEHDHDAPSLLPPSASPSSSLFSPTSDLLLTTSANRVILLENVEESLGNMMNPQGVTLEHVIKKGGVHTFSLESEDFPLGHLREIRWLERAQGTEIDQADLSSTPLPTSTITADTPAVLLCIESNLDGSEHPGDHLVEMEVFEGEIQSMFRTPIQPASAAAGAGYKSNLTIQRLDVNKELGHVFVQLSSGRVLRYLPACWQPELDLDDRYPILEGLGSGSGMDAAPHGRVLALPTACPWFNVVRMGEALHPIGRDSLGKLFAGPQLLSPQCSSFLADQHPLYVAFTILGQQNALFLLNKSLSLEVNLSPEHRSDPHLVRLLERGSALVAVLPSLAAPRVLLQMPRGNLEAIYPRALTLSSINTALSGLKFQEAFESIRRNKIDSNLLVDHFGVEQFHRVAPIFVNQLMSLPQAGRGVEYLNLFITNLTEESCLVNQYVAYKPLPLTEEAERMLRDLEAGGSGEAGSGGSKLDRIREQLMRNAAENQQDGEGEAAAAEQDDNLGDDAASDLGSVGSASQQRSGASASTSAAGAVDDLLPSHAVGEAAPYNYVPRKHGQSRRPMRNAQQRQAVGAIIKSKEEERRQREASERAWKENMAVEYEQALASSTSSAAALGGKVNRVCLLMRNIFQSRPQADQARFTLCILTTLLREEPKRYDEALTLVKDMRDREQASERHGMEETDLHTQKEASKLENKSATYAGYRGALQYTIFLSDVEILYDCALGLYDFDLVRLVAQYSHMDPKEYTAHLESLMALSDRPSFQHYHIDLQLGRHAKALTSLIQAWKEGEVPHDEQHWQLVLDLLKIKPELYAQAIEAMTPEKVREETRLVLGGGGGSFGHRDSSNMYGGHMSQMPFDPTGGLPAHFLNPALAPTAAPSSMMTSSRFGGAPSSSGSSSSSCTPAAPQSPELTPYFSLLCAYAAHLSSSRQSRHAAHAYLLACEYKKALQCLKDAGEWKECMVLAHQLGYQPEEIQQLAYDLSAQLRTETKSCIAAAQLLVEYADDVDEAVVVLLSGEQWFEILRVCYAKGREDLLETHVQPEIIKAFHRHIKHIQSHKKRYVYAITRLRIIRRVKLLFPSTIEHGEGGEGGAGGNDRDDDLHSIVSGMTASTSYSSASHTLSEASAFSGRSTSTVASTSSIFSIQSDLRREMTPDERRIQRHQDRLKRKRSQKKIKEGSIFEEEHMIKEVIETTPLDKHKERMSELIHALLHFGYVDQSRTLQAELADFLAEVEKQESTPMPMLDNPTPQQREALIKFWNWPGMVHPERNNAPKKEQLLMPFLFPAPSAKVAKEQQAQEAAQAAAQAAQEATSSSKSSKSKSSAPPVTDDKDAADEDDMFGGLMM